MSQVGATVMSRNNKIDLTGNIYFLGNFLTCNGYAL